MKYLLLAMFTTLQLFAAAHDVAPTKEFKVTGNIKAPQVFTMQHILAMKQVTLNDVNIKNHKGDDKGMIKGVKGVLLKDILKDIVYVYDKPKELSEFYFVFTASDGYKNVYSWNEIYNTAIGAQLYIITERDGLKMAELENSIQVISLADINSGRRYLKGLAGIEVRRVK